MGSLGIAKSIRQSSDDIDQIAGMMERNRQFKVRNERNQKIMSMLEGNQPDPTDSNFMLNYGRASGKEPDDIMSDMFKAMEAKNKNRLMDAQIRNLDEPNRIPPQIKRVPVVRGGQVMHIDEGTELETDLPYEKPDKPDKPEKTLERIGAEEEIKLKVRSKADRSKDNQKRRQELEDDWDKMDATLTEMDAKATNSAALYDANKGEYKDAYIKLRSEYTQKMEALGKRIDELNNSSQIQPGDVEDGFEFMGGDPSVGTNWKKVE